MTTREPIRYKVIADYLRGLIASSSPGDRLPSDAELCERFEVSRMTARQAVQLVAAEGSIERRRGAGTFVKSLTVPRDLGSPLSFTESMRARGMKTESRILEFGPVNPTTDEQVALGLGRTGQAHVLERLRMADGTPMAIERVVMPSDLALALDDDLEKGSLHAAFKRLGRVPVEAHAEVAAARASKRQRELLGLPRSGIVLCEWRTIFDQSGAPLERTETCYPSSRYSFRAVLRESDSR
jgi:GntR family transcriptional regulator